MSRRLNSTDIMAEVDVRPARGSDAQILADLMAQLGYEVPAAEIASRVERLDERRSVLVATVQRVVAGWIAVSVDEPFVTGREALVEGLVVDERLRSQGVGERLLHEAEAWARAHACTAVRVQSNVIRERAHTFYERNGYARVKTQHQFRKRL